ncbi:MAG: hypothetical protein IT203_10860 [Fimbriimonadaceae bacterium]|nr:hypothetical protein [Fimbriimonadaceae bacterium]
MLDAISILIALLALGVTVAIAMRLQQTEQRLKALLTTLESERTLQASALAPAMEQTRPLEGLRIALCITQDHPHPVFATLLREHLYSEDAREVVLLSATEVEQLNATWALTPDSPDILISGEVTCNGYAEVYYHAEITCSANSQSICKVIEKPPHGDRPVNLATGLVSRLKAELEKAVCQNDRRRALQELQGP